MSNIHSVLIIDDSAVQRQGLAGMLRDMRVEHIHEATNGFDALNWLQNHSEFPDILFCDLEMPVMDGVTMLQTIASCGYPAKIVVFSGQETRLLDAVAKMVELDGLDLLGVLSKPVQPEKLQKIIASYTDRHDETPKIQRPRQPYSAQEIAEGVRLKQMTCHFQPQISVKQGRVSGVEALVRWNHPLDGLVYPDAFIPHIEHLPIMEDLTLQVLTTALDYLYHWKDLGMKQTIGINVSTQALKNSGFAQKVIDQLNIRNIEPENLFLEIKESALTNELTSILGTTLRLRLHGCQLSIDDFGTNIASLLQLGNIAATELKIDRAFLQDMHNQKNLRSLLKSAIEFKQKSDLSIVAKGVEHIEEWLLLEGLGCELIQGYLVAKPMTGHQLQHWIQHDLSKTCAMLVGGIQPA